MKDRILAQFDALMQLIGDDSSLTALDHALITSSIAQAQRNYTHAHHRADRVDAGAEERARRESLLRLVSG